MINTMLRFPELVKDMESQKFYQTISSMDAGNCLSVAGYSGSCCNLYRLSDFSYELRVFSALGELKKILEAGYTNYENMMEICDEMAEIKLN